MNYFDIRRGLYAEDRDRILRSVKESVDEAGQKPEDSAYYFVIGLSIAIFIGLIIVISSIKSKLNELEVYGQKIQTEVNEPLRASSTGKELAIEDLTKQVESLQIALATRIDFAQFINDLTSNQYKKSKWTALSVNSDKIAITMEADNFEDVSKSLKSLENIKSVISTQLSNVNVNPDNKSVAYNVELKVDFNAYKVGKTK